MSRTVLRYRWRQLTYDDMAVDSSNVQGDIITTSFSDAVQSVRMLHANVEANGCLENNQWWVCTCGEDGSALMVRDGMLRFSAHST